MSDSFPALDSKPSPEQVQELAVDPASSDSVPSDREQFLRLHLMPDTAALLPLRQMTEVLTIVIGQIVPIPHMPDWVMGVYNWRGEILWMVDLGQLCGLTPWYEQAKNLSYKAVVLNIRESQTGSTRSKNQMVGLVVDQVEDVEWCDPDMIQPLPPSTAPPRLARFLRGHWWKPNDAMLSILDGEAIIKAMTN